MEQPNRPASGRGLIVSEVPSSLGRSNMPANRLVFTCEPGAIKVGRSVGLRETVRCLNGRLTAG
jgi:hypothetical protein